MNIARNKQKPTAVRRWAFFIGSFYYNSWKTASSRKSNERLQRSPETEIPPGTPQNERRSVRLRGQNPASASTKRSRSRTKSSALSHAACNWPWSSAAAISSGEAVFARRRDHQGGDGPLHGDARHHHERPGVAGIARKHRRGNAPADRFALGQRGRVLHSPAGHAPSGERTSRHSRRAGPAIHS